MYLKWGVLIGHIKNESHYIFKRFFEIEKILNKDIRKGKINKRIPVTR